MIFRTLFILLIHYTTLAEAQIDRYDVVINEIMADPSPIVGLPNAEYIELKNTSNKKIDLLKWRLVKGNTTAAIGSSFILEPDSLVVICSRTQAVFFNLPSKILGVTSFPALVNEGDLISLAAPDGMTVHAVEYNLKSYGNPLKESGGWSMEMLDPYKPCDANNWKASVHESGGSPGIENSVFKKKNTNERLVATQCLALNNTTLLLHLNQSADSISLSTASNYLISSPLQNPGKAKAIPPLFNTVELVFSQPLEKKKLYTLSASPITHCKKTYTDSLLVRTGIPEIPDTSNLVINELLFDPPPGGADFIELYNKGSSIVDVKEIWLSSSGTNGQAIVAYRASEKSFNFFPGDHLVLSIDTAFVARTWEVKIDRLIEMKSMPSLPDEDGNVVLMNTAGKIIDRLDYNASMHFPLIRQKEGISLERVNTISSSAAPDNWQSASSSSGYATPTKVNSQRIPTGSIQNTIHMEPDLISPNNDGVSDLLKIEYIFKESGTLLTVYLFNENGDLLDKIIDNRLCGTTGTFFWNGTDSKGNSLRSGVYILLASSFDLRGRRNNIKKVIGIKA